MKKKHKTRKPSNADMRAMTKTRPEISFDDFLATEPLGVDSKSLPQTQHKVSFNFSNGKKYSVTDKPNGDREFNTFTYCGKIGRLHSFKHSCGWSMHLSDNQLIGKTIKEVKP